MARYAKQVPGGGFLTELLGINTSPRFAPRSTIGTAGTAIFGGYIQTNETDSTLTGTERYKTYSEHLANVTIVGASVRFFLNLVGKAQWKFVPPPDSGKAGEDMAELVTDIFDDMRTPFHRVVRRAAMYRFYGFSIQEWTAKVRDDGNFGFLDIEARPQQTIERWKVDDTGHVEGCTQRIPNTMEERFLPRPKLLYMVDDALDDNPEGLGLFRHIVEACRRLQRYEQLEGFGFETDLRGIPIVRMPSLHLMQKSGLSKEQITTLETPLRNFAENHVRSSTTGIALDSMTYQTTDGTGRPSNVPMFDVDLLKAATSGLGESHQAIERVKREIAVVLGTEHLLLGSDSTGSFALSEDKANNLAMVVDSTNQELGATIKNDLLTSLFTINGWDEELMPEPEFDKVQWRDIEQVTRALRDMAAVGVMLSPSEPSVVEVFGLLGLTPPSDELIEDLAIDRELGREALSGENGGDDDDGDEPEAEDNNADDQTDDEPETDDE